MQTRRDAAAALRTEIRKSETGEWVEPSKQRLDAYLAESVQGQRLSAAIFASYRKSIGCTSVPTWVRSVDGAWKLTPWRQAGYYGWPQPSW